MLCLISYYLLWMFVHHEKAKRLDSEIYRPWDKTIIFSKGVPIVVDTLWFWDDRLSNYDSMVIIPHNDKKKFIEYCKKHKLKY